MFDVNALIYNGNAQQFVTHRCASENEFFQWLSSTYGVYVCLWWEMQTVMSSTILADASLHSSGHHERS